MKGAAEFGGDFIDQLGYGKGFGDVAREIASAGEVPDEQSEKLMRIEEGAVAIDGADAVAVTVGAKSGVVFAGQHSIAQRLDVRFDGLGVRAAETRVVGAANFVAVNIVAGEKLAQRPADEPCMGSETKRKFAFRKRSQSTSFSRASR